MKKNLTLTGMMGVGKSTIGRTLSKRISMQFIDIDKVIKKKLKLTIQKIFEKKGEPFFRKFEEIITLQELKKEKAIISLGGGAFMNSRIRNFVLLNSKSFWLDLNLKHLEERLIKSKKRPLLNTNDIKKTLEVIYLKRIKTYALANYKIDCNKLNSDLIVSKIIEYYENK